MSSREAFEKHVADRMFIITRDEHGAYTSFATHLGWELWKAATERAATICDSQHDRALTSSGAHRADCCAVRIREGNE